LKFVSERLGHSTIIQTADTYAHVMKDSEAKVGDMMGRVLEAGMNEAANGK
jgi:hypothetical protein